MANQHLIILTFEQMKYILQTEFFKWFSLKKKLHYILTEDSTGGNELLLDIGNLC